MATKIRAALIAFGLSGKVFHAPFLSASTDFELTVIVQRSGDEAGELYPDVKIERSFSTVLEDENIDLVVISTPNRLHFSMAKEALLAGKHVVLEKPFVATLNEGEELVALAKSQGKHLFVYHNRRWDSDFKTVRTVIEAGELGSIVSYESHFDRFKPELNAKAWKEEDELSIGFVHDLGTHLIDQTVCLFGVPESVTAHLMKERPGSKVFDAFTVFLKYPSLTATLKASCFVKEQGPRFLVHGQNGSFVKYGIDPQEADMVAGGDPLSCTWGVESEKDSGVLHVVNDGAEKREKIETLPGNYMGFYENVASVLGGEANMEVTHDHALTVVKIIDAALQSHQEKRTITF